MKRLLDILYLIGTLFWATPISYAQTTFKELGISHWIEVRRYADYNVGYLTLTDDYFLRIDRNGSTSFMPLTYEVTSFEAGKIALSAGDAILEVNGLSTAKMTEDEFYAQIKSTEPFTLKYRRNSTGEEATVTLTPKQYYDDAELNWYPVNRPSNKERYPKATTFVDGLFAALKSDVLKAYNKGAQFDEVHSMEADFSKFRTYDYFIQGDDPLNDIAILDKIDKNNLKRDKDNPDIIFTIAKDAENSISAIYIPPSSRTVNRGSKTRSQYNYFTKTYDYITTQDNVTVHEGGYTQTTAVSQYFLELSALEASKIDDPSITYAPVIWKMTATRNIINGNSNNPNKNEEFRAYASWASFPPEDREVYVTRAYMEGCGLIGGDTVIRVIPGSRADKAGFMAGDEIIKAKTIISYFDGWHGGWKHKSLSFSKSIESKYGGSFISLFNHTGVESNKYEIARYKWPDEIGERELEEIEGNSDVDYKREGWVPIEQDWEVTVRRNGKNVKLNLEGAGTKQSQITVIMHWYFK